MATILVWNDINSFKRHLESMRLFRQSHDNNPPCRQSQLRDMPATGEMQFPRTPGGVRRLPPVRRQPVVVPIWHITASENSQN
jgi:hypothetical protein